MPKHKTHGRFSIYGCWFLGMDAHHAAQVAKIEYLRPPALELSMVL